MKRLILSVVLLLSGTASHADELYGPVQLVGVQRPQVINMEPVMVEPAPRGVMLPPPLYLHVPPGYERHWNFRCHEFHACGRPVYFVREEWFRRVYAPYRHEHPDDGWRRRREWQENHWRGGDGGQD